MEVVSADMQTYSGLWSAGNSWDGGGVSQGCGVGFARGALGSQVPARDSPLLPTRVTESLRHLCSRSRKALWTAAPADDLINA